MAHCGVRCHHLPHEHHLLERHSHCSGMNQDWSLSLVQVSDHSSLLPLPRRHLSSHIYSTSLKPGIPSCIVKIEFTCLP